jgi:16S rRNA (guanine(966)-N(2))-methyltransferase RsmD
MRAIGAKKSKCLKNVRPTSGKALSALFNILNASGHIVGANVLDLFAGTGAVSLAALGNGARAVTAVESDSGGVAVIAEKFSRVGGAARVVRGDVRRILPTIARGVASGGEPYDVVFADPPYHMGWGEALPPLVERNIAVLSPGGVFVFERSAREAMAEISIPRDDRAYGETILSFYWVDTDLKSKA